MVTTADDVLVVSNDVVPGMGLPAAAPGLRAWGLAEGLRSHGMAATLAVVRHVADRRRSSGPPAGTPPNTIVMSPTDIGERIRRRPPRAVVVTNSNQVDALGDLGTVPLVYDFFAPKMLERSFEAEEVPLAELADLSERKLRALARADAVIVNGGKKIPYVLAWVVQAGRDVRHLPVEVVNMPVPKVAEEPVDDGQVHLVVSGYLQPWSRPGPWVRAVLPALDDGRARLDLMVTNHWGGQRNASMPLHDEFRALMDHPMVTAHGAMPFGQFQQVLSRCHASIDLFERNIEREYAMVTRTIVALASGVPAVHVSFTECSPLIEEHGAGWLVDVEDGARVDEVLHEVVHDTEGRARRREGARRLAAQELAPHEAVRPLVQLLEGWA